MLITELFLYGLAAWRITALLVNEDGPFFIFRRLRELVGIRYVDDQILSIPPNFFAQVLSCVWCCSVYVGLGMAFIWWNYRNVFIILCFPMALSAFAIIIELFVKLLRDR